MPLLDHFHPPLYPTRRWESFHGQWASSIATALNRVLPAQYFAEIQLHVGSRVEVDVGTFDRDGATSASDAQATARAVGAGDSATATLPEAAALAQWSPPEPEFVMPAIYPDSVEVLVYNSEAVLVGAIELISPGNKDRADARRSFAAKCTTYLQQGVGLVTVDVVTERSGNLHNELVHLLDIGDQFLLPPDPLFAVAYRPIRREAKRGEPLIEQTHVWPAEMRVGERLPLLPLALGRRIVLPLDLEESYTDARRRSRL
jgi:hypothetical protein